MQASVGTCFPTTQCAAVFKSMVDRGIDCHSYDMRSHGKSELNLADRGKIPSITAVVNDMIAFADKVKAGMLPPAHCATQL